MEDTVAHHGQKVKMRFSGLGDSDEKLELHIALAKKIVHSFEKPLKIEVFSNFEVTNDENVFFILAEIKP